MRLTAHVRDRGSGVLYLRFLRDELSAAGLQDGQAVEVRGRRSLSVRGTIKTSGTVPWLGTAPDWTNVRISAALRTAGLQDGDDAKVSVAPTAPTCWITSYWPPLKGESHGFEKVWVPNLKRDDADRLRPGDTVFVYETITAPREIRYEGQPPERVDRPPGRGGLIARLRIRARAKEGAPDKTRFDNKVHDFRFTASAILERHGWVPWSELRRSLGWDPGARPRGLQLYALDSEQAVRVVAAFAGREFRPQRGGDAAGGANPPDDPDALQAVARRVRRGQARLRNRLMKLYGHRCAVTGHGPDEVLEAAHIASHASTGVNSPSNAILLRADIHALFDDGLLRIHPDSLTVEVDAALEDTPYASLAGRRLADRADGSSPSAEALSARYRSTPA